jgi:hypothetical protein
MKIRYASFLLMGMLVFSRSSFGQSFVNLDFEDATIAPTPVGGWVYPADPAQCFPGWTVGGSGTVVMYNDLSLGAPAVCLMGPDFPNAVHYTPLDGSYSTLLYYSGGAGPPPTLSQTGLVPVGTQSINFLVSSSASAAVVTLNGVPIPLVPIAGGRLAGNVAAFAGSVAQLTFSTTGSYGVFGDHFFYFDDVQFSPTSVPEPSICSLVIVCILLLGWRLKRPNMRIG